MLPMHLIVLTGCDQLTVEVRYCMSKESARSYNKSSTRRYSTGGKVQYLKDVTDQGSRREAISQHT